MKLSNDEVGNHTNTLIKAYRPLLGLKRWVIEQTFSLKLSEGHAALTMWDIYSHLAQVQINTHDYEWSLGRDPGALNLQETVAHELIHLWLGGAHVYAQLENLRKTNAFTDEVAAVVDSMLEHMIDTIASHLVYEGALKGVN